MKLMPVGWKRLSIVWAAAWVGFTILYAIYGNDNFDVWVALWFLAMAQLPWAVAILERYMKE